MRAFVSTIVCSVLATALAAPLDAARIDSITLERTVCYGPCPIYKITLYRDGSVRYFGKRFVKVIGHRTGTMPVEKFLQLAAELEQIRFFELKDRYDHKINPDGSFSTWSDLPTQIVTVRAGTRQKRVEDYLGCPESLERIEDMIDEASNSSRWTGRRPRT